MKNGIFWKVCGAIALAVVAGLLTGPETQILGVEVIRIYSLLGQLFLNALTLVVVPLVVSSIITGTAKMGSERSFGGLGFRTFGIFALTTTIAVLIGFVLMVFLAPGSQMVSGGGPMAHPEVAHIASYAQGDTFSKIEQIALKIVPSNVLAAASQGQILGLLLFCMAFGYFSARIEPESSQIVIRFWQGIFQIMMAITHLFMQALPIGVFGLVAKVMATTGLEAVKPLALFFGVVMLALGLYALVALPLLLRFLGGFHSISYLRAMWPALLTAFSTSSSAASLPIAMECLERRVGVSNRIVGFALPLGASMSLSGTALYTCAATLFVIQSYGVALPTSMLIIVALMAILTSFGMAGIPSASLVAVVVTLQTVGVPPDGIALILAVERILDMFRTSVNVLGNAACASLVATAEGERPVIAHRPALS